MNFCILCGTKLNDNICPNCGTNYNEDNNKQNETVISNNTTGFQNQTNKVSNILNRGVGKNILGALVTVALLNGLTKKLYKKDGNYYTDKNCNNLFDASQILKENEDDEDDDYIFSKRNTKSTASAFSDNEWHKSHFHKNNNDKLGKEHESLLKMEHESRMAQMREERDRHMKSLSSTKTCFYCGKRIDRDSTFCKYCGRNQ